MSTEHEEIEAKFDAAAVSHRYFADWVLKNFEVCRFEVVDGPDDYYRSGSSVVRHRRDRGDGCHELTVKLRRSEESTRSRLEVDLGLPPTTKREAVAVFLDALGYERAFTVRKKAWIFWVALTPLVAATFVIYDVWREDRPKDVRRFVEVEAEKGTEVTLETARRHVREQARNLQAAFGFEEPVNYSLYELFSGERYQLAK